jgi:hypothetical protein
MDESKAEGWYPNPSDETQMRYWDGSSWTDNVAVPDKTKKPYYMRPWFIVLAVVVAISFFSGRGSDDEQAQPTDVVASQTAAPSASTDPAPSESAVTEAPSAEPTQTEEATSSGEYGTYSDDQKEFIRIIEDAIVEIEDAETELQQSVALRKRDDALCAVLNKRVATNWTGKITEVGSNSEGYAHVEIELADGVRVKTWNNAFSDIGDDTLISPSADFFDNLVAMSEDTVVTWSGKFAAGDSFCLKKANLTQTFYGIDPQFIVKFSNIESQ